MTLTAELAEAAARLIVDEGLDYGAAKRKAAKVLRAPSRQWPDNDMVEAAVRERLALFHADTQPAELATLRAVARQWMHRLAEFRPHLTGAVWRGTATRLAAVQLTLYCDDSKAAEIALLNLGVRYEVGAAIGPRGEQVDVLVVTAPSGALGEDVTLRLTILDHDDLRGALRADARGRKWCGDIDDLDKLTEP